LAFDCVKEARVRDRDRRLSRERLHELDMLILECTGQVPSNRDHADQFTFEVDWHTKQSPVPDDLLRAERVFLIDKDVGYLDGRAAQRDPAYHGRPVTSVRTLGGVVVRPFVVAALGDDSKNVSVREVKLPVITMAECLCRFHDLVEHWLQPLGPSNGSHNRRHGTLLLTKALVLAKCVFYIR
jgi:hypothetical protein